MDEEEGGGSGPKLLGGEGLGDEVGEEDVEEGWSGDLGGLGNQEGSMNRPSKGYVGEYGVKGKWSSDNL